jgi:hypothetical protein
MSESTVTKKTCDACGHKESGPQFEINIGWAALYYGSRFYSKTDFKTIDLCKDCRDDIITLVDIKRQQRGEKPISEEKNKEQ